MNRLYKKYNEEIIKQMMAEMDYSTPIQVPKLKKIVINMGLGEAVQNPKVVEKAVYALTQISGQKPVVTRAKKAISNFKIREGLAIGCMVTIRGQRMYDFLDRLVTVALPRVRDFRGLPKRGFDGSGNYTFGIQEQIVFPEIDIDQLDKVRGMNITCVTSAGSDDEGRDLLARLGLPFRV